MKNLVLLWIAIGLNMVSDQAFAIHKQKPLDLLLSHYKTSSVLALGESNHAKFQTLEYLMDLLRTPEVAFDPDLKVIASEFSHMNQEFLETNSITEYWNSSAWNTFQGNKHASYYWKIFLPFLRELNSERTKKNLTPILVTGIDGYPMADFPKEAEKVYGSLYTGLFWNRENGSSRNFQKRATSLLDDTCGKIIVYYHFTHLINLQSQYLQKVSSIRGQQIGELEILKNTPANWLSMVFQDHPDWRSRTSIVIFDEDYGHWDSQWQPKVITQLIAQLNLLEPPAEAFGISLREIQNMTEIESSILNNQGKAVFNWSGTDQGTIAELVSHLQGEARLSDMADAVIWTPHTSVKDLREFDD